MKFQLQSAAKVNLTLDILSRRADGYHELASVVHTIGIWDEITLELTKNEAILFSCNRAELEGDDNLCVRAIQRWNEIIGDHFGAKIHLQKRIPTGAGLGGGSGNAAAILLALQRATKNEAATQQLHEISAKLGADVPLFLDGGAVLMEGIGEKLTPLSPLAGYLLIVKPQVSFATPAIYRVWDEKEMESRRDTAQLLEIWPQRNLRAISQKLGNDLERAAAQISDLPALLIAKLQSCNALGAQMSGSGSACFGIFETELEARDAREILQAKLAKDVPQSLASLQIFVAPFCARGVDFSAVC